MIYKLRTLRIPKRCFATQYFVPKHDDVRTKDIEKIREFLYDKPRILILTGAGISTESGMFNKKFNNTIKTASSFKEFLTTDQRVSGFIKGQITSQFSTQSLLNRKKSANVTGQGIF